MTVQSHLDNLASLLNLKEVEKEKVRTSIETLSSRLDYYFGSQLTEHFKFGSYTRGTILPRKADKYSDVDYMLIFENPYGYKPQTLMNHIRKFVNHYYRASEISQSHPTIVLELNHIRFELVPAKKDLWGMIYIPSRKSLYEEWISTEPNVFNQKLTTANIQYNSKIKPLVRLMKYWNRINGGHLSSYELENWIAGNNYWGNITLKEYVYDVFEKLTPSYTDSQAYKSKLERAKKIIQSTKEYEKSGMLYTAESEIKKLFPDF
ncbi:nucleotidyltransferase [Exiguobacterium sp. s80]|uniref:SMODS domain-containing nucleotidyltransferase n=1 Tax=Exiguobacterium sp. s80 TaxID=2751209 RepID=UPI001BE700D1